MNVVRIAFPLAFVVPLFAACRPFVPAQFPPSGTFTALNASPREVGAHDPASIPVLSGGAPADPFVEVGLVNGTATHSNDRDSARIMDTIRGVAGEHGCDALYNVRPHDHGSLLGFEATCIVYRDEKASTAKPPSATPPDAQACKEAEDLDARASQATGPAKEQLQKMAEKKHHACSGTPQ